MSGTAGGGVANSERGSQHPPHPPRGPQRWRGVLQGHGAPPSADPQKVPFSERVHLQGKRKHAGFIRPQV